MGEALAMRLRGALRGPQAMSKFEEGLPKMNEENLDRAARRYRTTTGVGCDGSHPRVT